MLYARQWCSDPDDAVQEALIELTQLTEPPTDQGAWLFTTTKRRAINQTRGESRRRKRNQLATDQGESRRNGSTGSAWFESDLETREEIDKLQTELEQLEPLEREIIVAHLWGELTFVQIGELVDRSSSTVHRYYQSALTKLRQAWEKKPNFKIDLPKQSDSALQPKQSEIAKNLKSSDAFPQPKQSDVVPFFRSSP